MIMKTIFTLTPLKKVNNVALLVFLLFLSSETFGQNGQYVLDHTSNASFYTNPSTSKEKGVTPFVLDRKSSRSRYLYLSTELYTETAAAEAREISSLAFEVTEPGSNEAITEFYITIAQTTDTSIAQNMDAFPMPASNAVQVKYISSLKITERGWFEIEFDTPYLWDGVSNLIVEICKTNATVPSFPKNVKVATTTYSGPSAFYRTWGLFTKLNSNQVQIPGCLMDSIDSAYNTLGINSTNSKSRPNIRFTFKCDGNTTPGEAVIKSTYNYCLGGSIELSVINAERSSGLDYQWFYSNNNIDFFEVVGATSANLVVERQELDFYYLRSTGCSDDSPDNGTRDSQSVKVIGINTWNGVSWSMGFAPLMAEPVRITGDYDTAIDGSIIEACSIEVVSGTLMVRNEHTLKIKDRLKVHASATVIFENNASLIQENDTAINEGIIKYRRDSQPVRVLDYTYWSSPVSGQTPSTFSVGTPTSKIYFWNHLAGVQNWNNGVHNLPMEAGKGYIIRTPNGFPNSGVGQVFHGEFSGVPHNGEITVNTQGENPGPGSVYWNLIGNPYPSALDADLFLLANSSSIDGTLKFWTHNSKPSGIYTGSHGLNYNSNDYATYNFTGTVGAGYGDAATVVDPNDPAYVINTTEPGRYIAAGQSFMVAGGPVSGLGTVTFRNEMRVAGNNKTFFRTSNAIASLEKNRVWLEMKHEDGAFKQTLVGYIEGATNGLDWGFDGKMLETSPVLIYTKAEDQNLIIQGKALPFSDSDQIPLGFSSTLEGTFELNLFRFDGLFVNQMVYVEDTYTNTIHNLKEGVYSFHTVAGVYDDRFIIRFTNETLSVPSSVANASTVLCYAKNQVINLKSSNQILAKVLVFDASGRVLYQNKAVNAANLKIESIIQRNQLLLVQVTTEEGLKATYKIIY